MTHRYAIWSSTPQWLNSKRIAALILTSFIASPLMSQEASKNNVMLLQRFLADEDRGQCGFAQTNIETPFGLWSFPIYTNTDSRPGGCMHTFALIDPHKELAGLKLDIDFEAYGPQKQCDWVGKRSIEISSSQESAVWSPIYRIDTDSRNGGCSLEFSLSGRSDIELDLELRADGIGEQCPDQGSFVVAIGQPVKVRIKTDDRYGGCYLRVRLRSRTTSAQTAAPR
jgi:hypothetical protein